MRRAVPLVVAYCLVFALQTAVTRQVFTSRFPGGNDFFPRWLGGCRLLWEGADPYSSDTTLEIQRGVYGRPARPGEDQVAFAYPLYVLVFTWPTCLSRDFATVQAAWMTALVHLILVGTALMKAASGWRGMGAIWLGTLAWSVFVYPNARAVLLGQMAVVVFCGLALSLWALTNGRDGLAGASLAATTIKPQLSFLILPWLLLWSLGRRRRKVVLGFAVAMFLLLATSLALQPDWLAGFTGQLSRYPSYTELGSGIWIMTTYYLGTPPWIEWLLTSALLALLVRTWIRRWRADEGEMLWIASLTLVVTHFVSPRTATTHFAVFTLPLFLLFEWWRRRRPGRAAGYTAVLLVLVLVGSWLLFFVTVQGDQESALNYLPIPLLLIGALLAYRRPLQQIGAESA